MSSKGSDYVALLIRLADRYHDLARQQKVLCTASIDEINMAIKAIAVLVDQGIESSDALYHVVKSSFVKTPECEPFFDQAFAEIIKKGGK